MKIGIVILSVRNLVHPWTSTTDNYRYCNFGDENSIKKEGGEQLVHRYCQLFKDPEKENAANSDGETTNSCKKTHEIIFDVEGGKYCCKKTRENIVVWQEEIDNFINIEKIRKTDLQVTFKNLDLGNQHLSDNQLMEYLEFLIDNEAVVEILKLPVVTGACDAPILE